MCSVRTNYDKVAALINNGSEAVEALNDMPSLPRGITTGPRRERRGGPRRGPRREPRENSYKITPQPGPRCEDKYLLFPDRREHTPISELEWRSYGYPPFFSKSLQGRGLRGWWDFRTNSPPGQTKMIPDSWTPNWGRYYFEVGGVLLRGQDFMEYFWNIYYYLFIILVIGV